MKIRTINYVFKQGFIGLWRNRGMSIASIGSVAASLIVLGLVITLVLNVNNIADLTQMQFDSIQVYLQEGLSQSDTNQIGESIEKINGVKTVEYESKEQALRNMQERWGQEGYLLEYLEENPFPNSYIIHMESLEEADGIVAELQDIKGIDDIRYYREIIESLLRIAKLIRTIGLGLILILILIAMFIISNTIKLTLNARRQEVNIMKYVGATNWFIRWPFVLEGVILGLTGAIIALIVVYFGYQYTFQLISDRFTVVISAYMISVDAMMNKTIAMFSVLGAGVGALGSFVSLRKHLRV